MADLPSPATRSTASSGTAFDSRLVEVDIVFPDQTLTFSNLAITASGRKNLGALMNECELRINNLTRDQRQIILTKSSPLVQPGKERQLITAILRVGRKSYGTFLLFAGNVITSGITQPPDIGIVLNSLTGNFYAGNIVSFSAGPKALLSQCARAVAGNFSPPLRLQLKIVNDIQISNFAYAGPALLGVDLLNEIPNIKATIENDNTLLVLDAYSSTNAEPFLISEATGMVGIPQVTFLGVNVRIMVDPRIGVGALVQIQSIMNPAANGVYRVQVVHFEIANREQPFWYILECANPPYTQGTAG